MLTVSCQEVVEIDVNEGGAKLVVDGLITNNMGESYIKLSTTQDLFSAEEPPKVSDATVTISDNLGNSFSFNLTEPGLYQNTSFQGIEGRDYTLLINYSGQNYSATSTLLPVSDIDSLKYAYLPKTTFTKEGYHVFLFAKEPKNETNFYRFLVYENDSLYNGTFDLFVRSDEIVDEYIMGADMGYVFQKGDTVKIEMQSLTKHAYEYYTNLLNVLSNDGGLFSSPPVNPKTNLSNGAIGIFRASGSSAKEIIIKE
jgi:hypothetical protein